MKAYSRIIKKAVSLLLTAVIVMGITLCPASYVVKADSEQDQLEAQLKNLSKEVEKVKEKISSTKNDIAKEKEYQQAINEQIDNTNQYIETLAKLIADYNEQISGLEAVIAEREIDIAATEELIAEEEQEIDENIAIYQKQLRAMYISGNESMASIVLGASDFFDMLMKLELVKRVAEYNNSFINHLVNVKEEYEDSKAALQSKIDALQLDINAIEVKKREVQSGIDEWNAKLADLADLMAESEATLAELKAKQASYESDKAALDKESSQLEKEIQEIIKKNERRAYMGTELSEGTFLWPVPGYYTITSGYGSRWGTMHYGIDISSSGIKGADITAANNGVVIFVYNKCTHNYGKKKSCGCGGGFGNYCMIDHGGGYVTLYGHAEKITVKEGQTVKTGDVIGRVGSTGYSTGWHCHFEVRVDGVRKNPQSFTLIPA